jgi:PAS domain S-box-containing protein
MAIQLKMLHSRFFRRIFLLFLVCLIIPMVLVFLYSYHHVGKQLDGQNFRRLHQQVRTTSLSIFERLLFLRSELNLLSSRLPLKIMTPDDYSRDFEYFAMGSQLERFSSIFFQVDTGDDVSTIPVYGEIRSQPQLSRIEIDAILQGKTVILKHDQPGTYPSFFMVVSAIADRPGKGFLFGEISTEYLWGIGSMLALPPMTDLLVLDPEHHLLIASTDISSDSTTGEGPVEFKNCRSDMIHWDNGGNDSVAVCRKLFLESQFSVTGWTVVLSQSRKDIRTALDDFKILFPLFSLLSFLVLLLVSTIAIRRSLDPMQELKAATRNFASGKFDTKAIISSGDEFEELADDFNRMGTQLRNQFEKLSLSAEVGRYMATTMDARTLANKVLESICRHLGFDAGFIGWRTPGSDIFNETISHGLEQAQKEILIRQWQFPFHPNLDARVSQEKDLVSKISPALAIGADSAICLPLQFADQLSGVLMVFNYHSEPVHENPEEIMTAIVNELSVSLSNIHSLARALESEKKFRSIFENSAVGIALLDISGRFIQANASMCRMFGYSEEELYEKLSTDLLSSQSQPIVSRIYQELQKGGRDSGYLEESYIHKDGRIVWGMASHSLLRDQSGKIIYFINFIQDISELKHVRKEKETLEKQLMHAQKMESVGRLAGGVAHDFNNMLSIINGYAEMSIDMLDPSNPVHGNLVEIYSAGSRSAAIVRQLLTFARKQTVSPLHVDLNSTISSLIKMLQRLISENIELLWRPGQNLWSIKIDPSQVDQLMANLVVNARDAITDVGKLIIETKNTVIDDHYCKAHAGTTPGQYIMLAVSDDGCGMDKEIRDNLFEPFFTTKGAGKGTGLGLSMVYGIVKQNNGFIDVYSEPGKGTTFKIYLPRCEADSNVSAEEKSQQSTLKGMETILIAEDEPAILRLAQNMLVSLGYKVLTAEKPSDALRAGEEYGGQIHLLLTDVIMPEMNGRALASRLSAGNPALKTLYMSGYTADVIAHHGVLDKDVLFIQKPFCMQDLAQKVRQALDF